MLIEKNIPIPIKKYNYKKVVETLSLLEIGDSFILAPEMRHSDVPAAAQQIGIKTTQKKQPDSTIRVWRVK